MSNTPQGPGWWQASDGRFYPPEHHPGPAPGDDPAVAPAGPAGGRSKVPLVLAAVGVLALVAAAVAVLAQGSDGGAEEQVLLEPIGSAGPDPFSDPVDPEPGGTLLAFAEDVDDVVDSDGSTEADDPARAERKIKRVAGDQPGLYGGTRDEASCDAAQLVDFLTADPIKARAWAGVHGLNPADIPVYVDRLTSVNLATDARVLNHGFADDEAVARPSVLQRGSAVMVDERGVPRVRCSCGNPLLEPGIVGDEAHHGEAWSGFVADGVAVIGPADEAIESFELIDVATGEVFDRQAGSHGDLDGPEAPPDGPGVDTPSGPGEGTDDPVDEPDDGQHDRETGTVTIDGQVFEFDVLICRLDPEPGTSLELRGSSEDVDVHLRFGWADDAPAHTVAIELHTSASQGGWFLSEQLSGGREFELANGIRQSIGDSFLSYVLAERTVFARGDFTWADDAEAGSNPIEEDIVVEATCP